VFDIHAKFEVPSSNLSGDMEGVPNFKRPCDPFVTPFDLMLLFSLVLPVINLFAKFEVSSFNRSRDMKGVPNFEK